MRVCLTRSLLRVEEANNNIRKRARAGKHRVSCSLCELTTCVARAVSATAIFHQWPSSGSSIRLSNQLEG